VIEKLWMLCLRGRILEDCLDIGLVLIMGNMTCLCEVMLILRLEKAVVVF